jgi:redox-sensitive bicupin YhaK (pirin superfamily)
MAPPHFAMFWDKHIPRYDHVDHAGRRTQLTAIAGSFGDKEMPKPPPRSWASRVDADVAIATIRLEAGATWTLPPAADARTNRTLYFFDGPSVNVGDHAQRSHSALRVRADAPAKLTAGDDAVELLLLQGRPIGEPVVQHGPFVMNTRDEIVQAMRDYQRTRFGGWPWKQPDPVHARLEGRFAKHADGRVERADA